MVDEELVGGVELLADVREVKLGATPRPRPLEAAFAELDCLASDVEVGNVEHPVVPVSTAPHEHLTAVADGVAPGLDARVVEREATRGEAFGAAAPETDWRVENRTRSADAERVLVVDVGDGLPRRRLGGHHASRRVGFRGQPARGTHDIARRELVELDVGVWVPCGSAAAAVEPERVDVSEHRRAKPRDVGLVDAAIGLGLRPRDAGKGNPTAEPGQLGVAVVARDGEAGVGVLDREGVIEVVSSATEYERPVCPRRQAPGPEQSEPIRCRLDRRHQSARIGVRTHGVVDKHRGGVGLGGGDMRGSDIEACVRPRVVTPDVQLEPVEDCAGRPGHHRAGRKQRSADCHETTGSDTQ